MKESDCGKGFRPSDQVCSAVHTATSTLCGGLWLEITHDIAIIHLEAAGVHKEKAFSERGTRRNGIKQKPQPLDRYESKQLSEG